jgi:hypothetical protein
VSLEDTLHTAITAGSLDIEASNKRRKMSVTPFAAELIENARSSTSTSPLLTSLPHIVLEQSVPLEKESLPLMNPQELSAKDSPLLVWKILSPIAENTDNSCSPHKTLSSTFLG